MNEERENLEARAQTARGRMAFADALVIYREQLEANPAIEPTAELYRRKCIAALLKSWPDLEEMDVKRISERDCLAWAGRFANAYSPTVYNNTVRTLRQILAVASHEGA